ncbi:hypothetical protein JAAARDRAFT_192443 [Jaapia argillacea MUCL 33604]|uniref:Uncharacterized protein n=1 Tax=Jaapia argillacea MUCL 33604 TaxID=933084 RepID=A0A067Q5T7_9AGAM|nr:hypothetical protein JAAARDRAFT_192443 [Jaapia argillacea MUCL 33604]
MSKSNRPPARTTARTTAPVALNTRSCVTWVRSKSLTSAVDTHGVQAPTPEGGHSDHESLRSEPTVSPRRSFAEVVTEGVNPPASRGLDRVATVVPTRDDSAIVILNSNNKNNDLSIIAEGSMGTKPISDFERACDDDHGWTPIKRKAQKAKSLNSLMRARKSSSGNEMNNDLTQKGKKVEKPPAPPINYQKQAMAEANTRLSKEELSHMKRCKAQKIQLPDNGAETASSRGEGPSGKNKGPDPRNWGNADLSESDLDIEAQKVAMANWKLIKSLRGEANRKFEFTSEDEPERGSAADRSSSVQRNTQGFWFDPVSIELQKELDEANTCSARLAQLLRNHHASGGKSDFDKKPSINGNSSADYAVAVSVASVPQHSKPKSKRPRAPAKSVPPPSNSEEEDNFINQSESEPIHPKKWKERSGKASRGRPSGSKNPEPPHK